jgi:hypothetical protein
VIVAKNELIESIKLSNNGYVFAPSAAEIACAKENPDVFEYHSMYVGPFRHFIALKGV